MKTYRIFLVFLLIAFTTQLWSQENQEFQAIVTVVSTEKTLVSNLTVENQSPLSIEESGAGDFQAIPSKLSLTKVEAQLEIDENNLEHTPMSLPNDNFQPIVTEKSLVPINVELIRIENE